MINKDNYHIIHRISKRTIPFFKKENRFTTILKRFEKNDEANNLISAKILDQEPFMVARYGSVESRAIVNYKLRHLHLNDCVAIVKNLTGNINLYWKEDEKFLRELNENAGFFPKSDSELKKFVELMDICSADLDILGVWNEYEEFLPVPEKAKICKIREIEPWFYSNPWSSSLKNKNVLVIHPFEESVREQYKNRKNLYNDLNILPNFNLLTISAVQTIAGQSSQHKNWFAALDHMKKQILEIDFDVAIIGCGAYGFPLASYVKSLGKVAIHLGGVTQLLFGIKGKRWENWQHYTNLRKNNGENWIFAHEIPDNYKKIEGGCYW